MSKLCKAALFAKIIATVARQLQALILKFTFSRPTFHLNCAEPNLWMNLHGHNSFSYNILPNKVEVSQIHTGKEVNSICSQCSKIIWSNSSQIHHHKQSILYGPKWKSKTNLRWHEFQIIHNLEWTTSSYLGKTFLWESPWCLQQSACFEHECILSPLFDPYLESKTALPPIFPNSETRTEEDFTWTLHTYQTVWASLTKSWFKLKQLTLNCQHWIPNLRPLL